MVVQVIIRLTVYIDQELVRSDDGDDLNFENATLRGIDNMVSQLKLHFLHTNKISCI